MMYLFNFGISQDDAETERRALALESGDRVICIASAGEVPLNLLAGSSVSIDAVDIALPQIRLARLKFIAALHLEPQDAARFLGYWPSSAENRRRCFQHVEPFLDPADREYWSAHPQIFDVGVIRCGRFEQYLSQFNRIGLALLRRKKVMKLFECPDVATQQVYFDQELATHRIKLIFKIAFHPRIYRHRGMDEAGLIHSGKRDIARFFYSKFRDFCIATPARQNYFLQFMLFNRILFAEALPKYLTESGNAQLRQYADRLRFFLTDIKESITRSPRHFYNKFALSNIGDWMTADQYAQLLRVIVAKAQQPARVLLRYIHYAHSIPADLQDRIRVDLSLGQELEKTDRFPFYNLIPMAIG